MTEAPGADRRAVLKAALIGVASAATTGLTLSGDVARERTYQLLTGTPESLAANGLHYAPDGHISTLEIDGELFMWVPAGRGTSLLTGSSLETLGNAQTVFGPDNAITERGVAAYRSIHSVILGQKSGELYGFYHQEFWPSENKALPFVPEIGLAVSQDNGNTWQVRGPIITGFDAPKFPQEDRVLGAGQPCAVVIGDTVRVYYVDWNKRIPTAIHAAQAPLTAVEDPGAWKKFDGKNFSIPAMGGKSLPVAMANMRDIYASLPTVVHHSGIDRYVMTTETDSGFALATSKDGLRWSRLASEFTFPQRQSARKTGDVWYSYPTLMMIGENEGFLYYSRGVWNTQPHTMERMPLSFRPVP